LGKSLKVKRGNIRPGGHVRETASGQGIGSPMAATGRGRKRYNEAQQRVIKKRRDDEGKG